jgi:2-polyprenyl-3-methyl-5-hydroxy-6-metoxy-1,4-benzoquinol methylase
MPDAQDLEKLLATLRDRVEQRRRSGEYPPGLESQLDEHFRRLLGERPATASLILEELDSARAELARFQFAREQIPTSSRIPGGTLAHKAIAKAIARQLQGIIDQTQAHAQLVGRTVSLVSDVANTLSESYDTHVLQQLDDLQVQLVDQRRALNDLNGRLVDALRRVPGSYVSTWYSSDAFVDDFRGPSEWIYDRYRDLAQELVGCDPVLDVGFGRGEFLELLRDAGVDAWGIEPDPALVDSARTRGLRVEAGTAYEYVRDLDDGSLGGLVMIQVIEHLSPQQAVDIVRIAADKVRRGGRVLVETVNPTSLYTYAHAFWVDPDHVRPVHPGLLSFLFRQAGFASVETLERSPVADEDRLELFVGDDDATRVLNANFEKLNALLYGPQDYAILATR